ncbi:MAG: translation initiation factor IF-2 [Alphaproteobacteria bacterium]|nr:translation initiation factor IF-2 [Alphaproteobacteria bacterium]
MSESKDSGDTETGAGAKRTLSLKKTVGAGQVRQSFSHGRTKAVVVEHKRKRTLSLKGEGERQEEIIVEAVKPVAVETVPADVTAKPVNVSLVSFARQTAPAALKPAPETAERRPMQTGKGRQVLRTLTEEERVARERALAESRESEAIRAAADAERRKMEAVQAQLAVELGEKEPPVSETVLQEPEPEAAALEARDVVIPPQEPSAKPDAARKREELKPAVIVPEEDEEEDAKGARGKRKAALPKAPARTRDEPRRRAGRLSIQTALDDDLGERQRSLASIRRARERERYAAKAGGREHKIIRDVVIPEAISVQDLANRMAVRGNEVLRTLRAMGETANMDTVLEPGIAQLVVEEMGHVAKLVAESDIEIGLDIQEDDPHELQTRPPVVTVMGHVDHGKTSLLDALRKTNVVSGEKGGITQHIGAYQVVLPGGQKITFIDTPGHEAFTAMRARGASATDIVVLVVAADDGVKPQTIEAIRHAKAANVPIIVAINKMDKHDANPDRVRQELLSYEIFTEELGGEVLSISVSALKGTNLDKLLEAILLQAELLDLKANPKRKAHGVIIEARLDKGRGPVATVLVKGGTLRRGDILVAGAEMGRVRALVDEHGQALQEAGPSTPVEVLGLQSVPNAGDDVIVVDTETRAREVSAFRQRKQTQLRTTTAPSASLEDAFAQLKRAAIKELPIVLKGDVQGSVEAIQASLEKLSTDEVRVRLLQAAVGGITESDISLAAASHAPVFGFNVRANNQAKDQAEASRVEIRYYNIIYDLIDDVRAVLSGMLAPERRETMLGNARVLDVFKVSKMGKAAGGLVTEGVVRRGAGVRVIRDNVVIHEGSLSSLRRFKDEVREVQGGTECGMAFENFQDLRVGDIIECFEVEHIARTL